MTRSMVVLGATNTGKSTLIDALAAVEGRSQPAAAPFEARVVSFTHLGEAWQAIDTPGSGEFLHVAQGALLAADIAVICVAPDPSAAVLAAPSLRAVEAAGTPAVIFINRIDEAVGRVSTIVAALQDYATRPIILRQVPIRTEGRVTGAVDLVSERAFVYREGGPSQLVAIPEGALAREHEAREALLETLADFDDHLLEELIEEQEPPSAEVYALCAKALAEGRVVEALIGSALHGNGLMRLMKALRHEAPHVESLRARLREQVRLDADPAAVIFAGAYRKHMGRTVLLRALGDLPAARLLGGRTPGQISSADPRETRHLDHVEAGTVVSAVKADHLAPGRLAALEALEPAPDWTRPQPAMMHRLLATTNERDSVKLSGALATLADFDAGMIVAQDPVTGGALVSLQGPLHMRLLRQRLKEAFGLDVEEHAPSPAYRETIAKSHEIAYRHKKQTGGAGQFADVKLKVAPAPRGAGFSFAETVKGGAVPKTYIPAVETGAREALERGPLGFGVVDVAVTLTDGLHHPVDSSDMAFRIAGRQAVREALAAAGPVLLQPVFRLRIHAPSIFTGAFGPIVAALRGQVLGFAPDDTARGWDVFEALAPAAALPGLANDVRSATQGVGYFAAAFDHYEEVHGKEASHIVEDHAREAMSH